MVLRQSPREWVGKRVKAIRVADTRDVADLVMKEAIEIVFDDDSVLALGIDWRGDEAYISQYAAAVILHHCTKLVRRRKRVGRQQRGAAMRYKVTQAEKAK